MTVRPAIFPYKETRADTHLASSVAGALPRNQSVNQRSEGSAFLRAEPRRAPDGSKQSTHLKAHSHAGALQMRFPHSIRPADPSLTAVVLNTAGGLTGGDRIAWRAEVGADAALRLTSAGSERIYRALDPETPVTLKIELDVDAGGALCWFPHETILYGDSACARDLIVDIKCGGEAILVDSVVLGRQAHGEIKPAVTFSDRWKVSYAGRLVHREAVWIDSHQSTLFDQAAALGGDPHAQAYATLVYIGPGAAAWKARLDRRLATLMGAALADREYPGCCAVEHIVLPAGEKVIARMVAEDGYQIRKMLQHLMDGAPAPHGVPPTWHV